MKILATWLYNIERIEWERFKYDTPDDGLALYQRIEGLR